MTDLTYGPTVICEYNDELVYACKHGECPQCCLKCGRENLEHLRSELGLR